jgi:hypothetical protein
MSTAHCPHKLGDALATPVTSAYKFFGTGVPGHVSELSMMDELRFIHLLSYKYLTWFNRYIMSLVGLKLSAQHSQWKSGAPPVSTFVLSPDKLEVAVAQAAAELIWIGKGGLMRVIPKFLLILGIPSWSNRRIQRRNLHRKRNIQCH